MKSRRDEDEGMVSRLVSRWVGLDYCRDLLIEDLKMEDGRNLQF